MAPDDFAVGMYVTILSWKPREVEHFPAMAGLFDSGQEPRTRVVKNTSNVGKLLRVTGVDLPFVAVECIAGFIGKPHFTVLDTRECEVKRLAEAFIQAHPDWHNSPSATIKPETKG